MTLTATEPPHAVDPTPWPGEPTTDPVPQDPDTDPGSDPTTDPMEPPYSPTKDPDELVPDEEDDVFATSIPPAPVKPDVPGEPEKETEPD